MLNVRKGYGLSLAIIILKVLAVAVPVLGVIIASILRLKGINTNSLDFILNRIKPIFTSMSSVPVIGVVAAFFARSSLFFAIALITISVGLLLHFISLILYFIVMYHHGLIPNKNSITTALLVIGIFLQLISFIASIFTFKEFSFLRKIDEGDEI